MGRVLVFGASGQIGAAVAQTFASDGWHVIGTSRNGSGARGDVLAYDPFSEGKADVAALTTEPLDAVVWAQGANLNDSVLEFQAEQNLELYRANTLFVAASLHALLKAELLPDGARLCVISSVWQTVARRNKLSYMISKAALQGLVMSAAVDLAERGMLINALLPGALDTPMTRANLRPDQIEQVAAATPFHRLPELQDVAAFAHFLCSARNTSVTGQFIAVDLGFQHARLV